MLKIFALNPKSKELFEKLLLYLPTLAKIFEDSNPAKELTNKLIPCEEVAPEPN
jgi:hypothetical protein